jgi:hypothetical protein
MTDFHPRHVIDRFAPDRTSEVEALRTELVEAQARAAYWRSVAEETALGLGRARRERDEARAERDRARRFTLAIAAQRPTWEEGPDA